MSVESIVIATDLNKTFKTEQKGLDDVQALQGINMQIKAGQLTALVGPDGAGKTTFLRLIAGLYKPTTGSLKVLGMDVAKDPQSVQDRISYMPQKFGLYEDLSIQENLDLYADLHGVPMDVRKERFARLLKITDLARFTERPAGKLSGGMKQKLGLACTLVRSPELLLLDEPSVGVDPLSRRDNGAGKTTTFRMLCGLLPASSGVLEVAGMNLRTARAQARAKIGYVSQKFALYGNLSVLDNLKFFGGAYGLSGKQLKQQIDKALLQFELKPHAKSGDLPNGFKQRLSMAAALLHQPEIVFLDEPTSGIDPLARRSFWYTIGELANQGMTIIVTTHFMEEAEYCDRIAIQDAGKLLAIGTPQQIRGMAQLEGVNDMNGAFIAIVEQSRADMQAH